MTDYNSTINQGIKGKFIKRHILTCFSYEMEAIFSASSDGAKDLPFFEEVENLYYFDRENVIYKIMEGFTEKTEQEFLGYANDPDTFNRRCKTEGDFECFLNSLEDDELEELCEHFKIDIGDERSTPHEIFEWWIVTEYLYAKLRGKGQPVLEWGNNCYWGRCTTGQAILLDHVISEICKNMEILDGQKYSWA